MAAPVVVLDACVLYPAPLRDLLLRLALTGLYRPRWTARIQDEWIQTLVERRPDLKPSNLQRTRQLMEQAVPDCLIRGYEPLISSLELPDPNDRHVLAAAVVGQAETIITFNLSDFPDRALAPYKIDATHPDDFVAALHSLDPAKVVEGACSHLRALRSPPKTVSQYLEGLSARGLTRTVELLSRESLG